MWYTEGGGVRSLEIEFPELKKRFWGAATSCGRMSEDASYKAPGQSCDEERARDVRKRVLTAEGRSRAGPASLDLGAVLNVEQPPSELQLRREKFAYFEKRCSKVAEGLFLGSDTVARSREILREAGVSHVLNCVGFLSPEYFVEELQYKTLWLQDTPAEDITSVMYDVFNYVEEVMGQGGSLYVHCSQGVSRSATLVIAYIMWRDGKGYDEVYQRVRAVRGVANPNMGFACQWHKRLAAPPEAVRLYRMAPHSEHDPRYLVPKKVESPSIKSLDVRGAFVVHTPHVLWVWVGAQACESYVSSAVSSAAGLVKYEGAASPPVQVLAGEEPPALREVLGGSSYPEWKPLETRVEEFTRDFDIFFGEPSNKMDRHGSLGLPGGGAGAAAQGSAGGVGVDAHAGGAVDDDDDDEDDDYWLMEA